MGHTTTRAIQYASYEAHKKDVGQLAGNMAHCRFYLTDMTHSTRNMSSDVTLAAAAARWRV